MMFIEILMSKLHNKTVIVRYITERVMCEKRIASKINFKNGLRKTYKLCCVVYSERQK